MQLIVAAADMPRLVAGMLRAAIAAAMRVVVDRSITATVETIPDALVIVMVMATADALVTAFPLSPV
jgi:hypothetical protein